MIVGNAVKAGQACWVYAAHGIPTLLDPVHDEQHHEPGPLAPFKPASGLDTAPSCTSLGRGKGQGVPAQEGVLAEPRGLLRLWAVSGWEYLPSAEKAS